MDYAYVLHGSIHEDAGYKTGYEGHAGRTSHNPDKRYDSQCRPRADDTLELAVDEFGVLARLTS